MNVKRNDRSTVYLYAPGPGVSVGGRLKGKY